MERLNIIYANWFNERDGYKEIMFFFGSISMVYRIGKNGFIYIYAFTFCIKISYSKL